MIVCVLLSRFELAVALRGRGELLGAPVALAPAPGGPRRVGEVSPAAEAFGIHAGMRLGEALARCPRLTLVAPDPAGVADAWERMLVALEGIGAAVEAERAGLAYFDARGLLRLHGEHAPSFQPGSSGVAGAPHPAGAPRSAGVPRPVGAPHPAGGPRAAGGDPLARLLEATGHALAAPGRLGVGPVRFVALAAATRARPRRPLVVAGDRDRAAEFLAPFAVSLLRARPALAELPESLKRLGIGTLGELAALPRAALADRFGVRGVEAHRLAVGEDDPLRPRVAGERLSESLQLPEAGSGEQLQRALGMLIDRLLARHEREGRSLRAVVLAAELVERGGTWRERVVFREALADPARMRLALAPRLALLPAPAQRLILAAECFGPACAGMQALLQDPLGARRARLREAVRQARVVAGPDAALRVLELDPGSRLPERRVVLTPLEP